jgi:hypothetical protein
MLSNKAVSPALQRIIGFYMGAVLLIAPFASIVLLPSVSASVPAFILIYLFLPLFIYYSLRRQDGFFKELMIIAAVFAGINMLAQLYVYYSGVQLSPQLILVKTAHPEQVFFRKSMLTQSAYLFAGILVYLYVKNYARHRHLSYFYWGLRVLVAYGLLEVVLYQLTGSNGDFISNRQFDHTSGSLFQTMKVGGMVVQRLKSFTGEPSMFAFTIVPFWILAVGLNRKVDMVLFALALLLTFSTSAYLGIAVLTIAVILHEKKARKYAVGLLVVLLFITLGLYYASSGFHHFMHDMVIDKLMGSNTSGQERSHFMKDHLLFWWNNMNIAGKFTGLGFGYVRSTDFFSTLLVNNGLIGFFLFTWFYFKHAFLLFRNAQVKFYYRTALIATYLIMMLSVPEFAYLSLWILLAYPYTIKSGNHRS